MSVAELDTTSLGGSKGCPSVLRNRAPNAFRYCRDDVDRQSIRVRHIRSNEINAALLQAGNEVEVTASRSSRAITSLTESNCRS